MPLCFTKIADGRAWRGSTWAVTDEDELAKMIALVAVGQATIVEHILQETGCVGPRCVATVGRQGAYNLLSVRDGRSAAHRDGWMFQVISWIAAHLQMHNAHDRALIRPPHMIHAEKGQDGLIIEYFDDDIARVVICEDKASKSPRNQIRRKVLPDFEYYETGARDNELVAAVTSVLRHHDVKDVDSTVENILWEEKRAYRVAATVNLNDVAPHARSRLFKGYAKSVTGDVWRRRVEIMPLAELRDWMATIAKKAVDFVKQDV